jgi:FkbM family methyltransferase
MPTIAETLNQGWSLHQSGRLPQAEQLYQQALAAQPKNPNAWCYLGMLRHDQERYSEALAAYRRALDLQPNFPIALNNLGNTYRLMRRLDDAIAAFDRAIEQKPDYLIAFKNKATTLCWEGRVADALRVYEQAVEFAPDDADVHKHLGIMRLLLGDFAGGWPEYDWRWKTGEIKFPQLDIPRWDGSPLDGKSILLTPEQGLGDTIHFIRYAAWLKERYKNCRVIFHCPQPLRQLLASCPGIDEFVATTDNLPRIDYFAPLLHIPSVLGHTPADFPVDVPYITADESLVQQWRERLAAYPGRKIGLAWRGSPTHMADTMRSIPLAEFVPLLRLKGVHFFSLQKGQPAQELNSLAGRLDVIDLGTSLDEKTGAFVDTAAVMKNLDLVIACDTAIAHVAGALAVPVWVGLCNVPDWRWLASGDTTVWYPTMRLFRQTKVGDWSGVTHRMAAALSETYPDLKQKSPDDYVVATSGFNRLNRTQDGLVLYDRHDPRFGRYLQRYGQYAAGEAELLEQAVQPGWTVVEAGAGPGLRTLMLSRRVGPRGFVLAFEHGPLVFQTLCANLALNSVTNVRCRNELLGDAPGSVNVAPRYREGEAIAAGRHEPRAEPGSPSEAVRVVPLDSLNLSRCNLLKIDVESMELRTLQGAKKTIERYRPLIYTSAGQPETTPQLIEQLQSLGYQLFWHTPTLFGPDNFYQNPVNEFGNAVAVHIFAIHSSVSTDIHGLRKIDTPHSNWRG